MTKETKAQILYAEMQDRMKELSKLYDKRYREAQNIEELLEVQYWHTERENIIEKWFIKSFLEIANEDEY